MSAILESDERSPIRHDDHPTPLPWEVTIWDRHVFVHGGPNGDDIADFNFREEHTVKITKDEAIANAVLFAASLDLLTAAKELSRLAATIYVAGLTNAEATALRAAYDDLDAAIAKATVTP